MMHLNCKNGLFLLYVQALLITKQDSFTAEMFKNSFTLGKFICALCVCKVCIEMGGTFTNVTLFHLWDTYANI